MKRFVCLVGILAGSLAIGARAAPLRAQQDTDVRPNLAGQWRLNGDLSDRPPEPGASGRGGGRSGGFGGPVGGGGMGGGTGAMGPGGGAPDPEARARIQEAMRAVREAPALITIVQDEPKLTLTDSEGRVRILYTDNRKMKNDSDKSEARTKWDKQRLVSETKFGGGVKLVEVYELASDGRQLIVTTKLENTRMPRPLSVRRVYDQVGSATDVPRLEGMEEPTGPGGLSY